ncbi:MAG: DUF2232 domain-containing protein [Gemmatimonadota bacterium]|nr:DUF2232 domain-containing protein [Gemmatimonadota bacterium]
MGAPEVERPALGDRRRSFWRAVALAGVTTALLPPSPTAFGRLAVIGIPVAVYVVATQWRRGFSLVFGLSLLVLLLAGLRGATGADAYLWRGWGLLLGGGFVVMTSLAPKRTLFTRGLGGIVLAGAVVAGVGLLRPEVVTGIDASVRSQYDQFFLLVELGADGWEGATEVLSVMRDVAMAVYPALVGLASLSALCVASYVARRLEGVEAALSPLRWFTFSDHLAWTLIVGLILLIAPLGAANARLGGNLVMFMGGLYVFRGLAVLAWLGTTVVSAGWWIVVWVLAAVLFYPVTLGTALVMGLSDTWLDLRSGFGVESGAE